MPPPCPPVSPRSRARDMMAASRTSPRAATWALVRATRPVHLLLILVVDLWGVAIAVGADHPPGVARVALGATALGAAALGAVAMLVVATSVHLANEWADRDTDALTTRTPFSGGSGATVDGDLPEAWLDRTVVASMVAASVVVGALAIGGWMSSSAAGILAVVAVAGWAYSLPPAALSRRGWGEVENALLGGLALPLFGVATVTRPTASTLLAVLPFTLLVFANLLATQWPDRWADAAVGKFTLVRRWSRARLRTVHAVAIVAAFVLVLALPPSVVPTAVRWASLAAAPVAAWAIASFTRDDDPLPTVATMVVFVGANVLARVALALPLVTG